jgi:hypothetical protein
MRSPTWTWPQKFESFSGKIENEEQKFEFLFKFDVCVFALWPIFKQNPPSSDSENEPAIISSSSSNTMAVI